MILWDVNVWVYAFRSDSPMHETARETVTYSLESGEPLLFCPFVAASFLRRVTNARIFTRPSEPTEAWRFLDYLESSPGALLAAAAVRYDAELVTADRGFVRFPGLRVRAIDWGWTCSGTVENPSRPSSVGPG